MKLIRLISVLVILLTTFNLFAQQPISEEIFYLYTLKVYNKELVKIDPKYYAESFDKANYDLIKNDEFKRDAYYEKILQTIRNKVKTLTFKNEFTYTTGALFGDYNFDDESFPVHSTSSGPLHWGWILNRRSFDSKISFKPKEAEKFINSRKKNSGYIDRNLDEKTFFSFVNQPHNSQSGYEKIGG